MATMQPETRPEAAPATPVRSSGAAAAALLAAGIGALVLGILTTAAEMSETLKDGLTFSDPVGPLSGKTIIASAAFFVSWPILHYALRNREPSIARAVMWTSALLIAAGLLFTFPPFFELFAAE